MNVVLDVSAALDVLRGARNDDLQKRIIDATCVYAPSLYDYEATNVVWKYVKARLWSAEEAITTLRDVLDLVDERISGTDIAQEALELARHHGHSAYDMFYIVIARQRAADLLTCDTRLAAIADHCGVGRQQSPR